MSESNNTGKVALLALLAVGVAAVVLFWDKIAKPVRRLWNATLGDGLDAATMLLQHPELGIGIVENLGQVQELDVTDADKKVLFRMLLIDGLVVFVFANRTNDKTFHVSARLGWLDLTGDPQSKFGEVDVGAGGAWKLGLDEEFFGFARESSIHVNVNVATTTYDAQGNATTGEESAFVLSSEGLTGAL